MKPFQMEIFFFKEIKCLASFSSICINAFIQDSLVISTVKSSRSFFFQSQLRSEKLTSKHGLKSAE